MSGKEFLAMTGAIALGVTIGYLVAQQVQTRLLS